ncbi:MAG: amidohydrolase [Desulfobacteraceae bacterium]|jgi:5-methylthioadenosine/S-adenosylhomocysteine deaminase
MEQLDLLIKNGTILTMDTQNAIIKDGVLGIKGDTISYIGSGDGKEFQGKRTIDAKGGLILPGLINGHTHAAMTLFRGLADDLPLMEWLNNYIFPAESRMDADFVYSGTLLACAEMIMSGTTTFCDMYLFEDEVARAAKEAGMRSLVGEVLYDFDSPNYGPMENGLKYTEDLINKWQGDPLVSIAVEPHSLFTCSPELLSRCNELALKCNVPLIIHVAETRSEIDEVKKRYGKGPVEHLKSLRLLGPQLIADHCVHLGEEDIKMFAENDVKAIHNPESNMKLASGIAPVPDMLKSNVTVGLGTDGCASNNNLDLFAEMDMAAKLHKISTMDTTVMDAVTVMRMATIEGAKALGMGEITGSLEKGKKADVIILDTKKPHLTPMYNPFSHLVYSARGNDVTHCIINGQLLMEDRKLLGIDLYEIMEKARQKSRDVRRWLQS